MPPRLYKKFDEVVVSCEVGMRKPNPKMYKLILKRLKISPKQTLFIDNQEWNTKPAKKLGEKVILYKNNKQLFKELNKLGI
jgi:putative hydrolase of the HAD superfamily